MSSSKLCSPSIINTYTNQCLKLSKNHVKRHAFTLKKTYKCFPIVHYT